MFPILHLFCGDSYKHITLIIYDSRVVLTKKYLQYTSKVINYKH